RSTQQSGSTVRRSIWLLGTGLVMLISKLLSVNFTSYDISMTKPVPKSQMLRVPTVLIPIVRELSRLHREGHTTALLQRLQSVVTELDSKTDIDHYSTNTKHLEEKLEALNNRVAQLEGALIAIQRNGGASNNYRRYKNSGNPYNQSGRPPQIEALDEEKLALRLNVNIPTLKEKYQTLDKREFEEWSKERDRSKYMWRFNEKDGLYHPAK
ncbi:MAG: hypothetical protein AAFX46_09260, partial [Cyanobacteria bacterium J06636_27]